MSIIKRITATVTGTMDTVVSRVENHDAIAQATIKEIRQNVAKTQARLNMLRGTGHEIQQQINKLTQQASTWRNRASQQADVDQTTALKCLERHKQCLAQIENLKHALKQYQALEVQVAENLIVLEQRLTKISQQYNLLRSRQSVADVNRIIGEMDLSESSQLASTFEHWETAIIENELVPGQMQNSDALEQSFIETEINQALLLELEELKSEKGKSNG